MNNKNSEKLESKNPRLRPFFTGGGAIGAKIVINVGATIVYIPKKGTLTAVILTAAGVFIKKSS